MKKLILPEIVLLYPATTFQSVNPVTKIRYELRVSSYASLKVYDILGKEVVTLVNQKQNAGSYEVEFNGGDFSGGVYFYTLKTGKFVQTKRMVLLK